MRVEHFYADDSEHKNIAFIFSPSENRVLDGNDFGGELFFKNGYDTIAFKISNDDWFQSIPASLFSLIHKICHERQYQKKIAYGSSMGGFASIAFSRLLECTTVIAFSPQYSIDQSFDRRWTSYAKRIAFKYRISQESIAPDCHFFVFYDNKDPDHLHVSRLMQVISDKNLELIKLPFTGHPSAHYLAEVGLIKDVAIKIANENNVEGIDFLRSKKTSKSYLHSLSYNLAKRNKLKYALLAIDMAIKKDERIAEFYRLKSLILERMGQLEAAIAAINFAMSLEPNHVNSKALLDGLIKKQSGRQLLQTPIAVDLATSDSSIPPKLLKVPVVTEGLKSEPKSISLLPGAASGEPVIRALITQMSGMNCAPEDVIAAYKIFLGRLPESRQVIEPWVGALSEKLLIDFLVSNEFLSNPDKVKFIVNLAKKIVDVHLGRVDGSADHDNPT